jgi:hypothetical protein
VYCLLAEVDEAVLLCDFWGVVKRTKVVTACVS